MSDGPLQAVDDGVWETAALAAALLAIDPVGLGGMVVRSRSGPVRDRLVALIGSIIPKGAPIRKVPVGIADDRLLGGLDLSATLALKRPVADKGLLAGADCGIVLLASAERVSPATAARIGSVMDTGEVALERDGMTLVSPARFGVLALDEGALSDEQLPALLSERLAFRVDLDNADPRGGGDAPYERAQITAARARLDDVSVSRAVIEALSTAAATLGVASLRASLLAVKAARASAALAGRDQVDDADAACAAGLVFGHRATRLPAPAEEDTSTADDNPNDQDEPDQAPPDQSENDPSDQDDATAGDGNLGEITVEAAAAAIPAGLLAQLQAGQARVRRAAAQGRFGANQPSSGQGRPIGSKSGLPRGGATLDLVATLRAAVPWQRLRRSALAGAAAASAKDGRQRPRLEIRPSDLKVSRRKNRTETATIFVVDASGSSALSRMAEAKGAVELLLAECYVRRDQVALISFGGRGVEVLLPPTRSLVRAKRSLAALPGGGGTPLATALEAATALTIALQRKGATPVVVLMTDGRANISREGKPGRVQAEADALAAARAGRVSGARTILVDTSAHPGPSAQELARAMDARYIPLPNADASLLSKTVQQTLHAE